MATTDSGAEVDLGADTTAFERDMRLLGEQFAALIQHIREGLAPAFEVMGAALSQVYYLDPEGPYSGRQGEPVLTEADARAALDHAARTVMLRGRRLPKCHRRYAKARYLACRRLLGEAALREVATRQFLST